MNISKHSIKRYAERTGSNPNKRTRIENQIKSIIKHGDRIKPKYYALKLMNNGYREAEYYQLHNLIAVVSDNTVVTIMDYYNQKKKWVSP